MIQEAINNAIKYAEADHITVTLSRNRTNLEAMIVDNGKGFDVKSPELGNGLTNMKKRMKDIQGEIKRLYGKAHFFDHMHVVYS